MVLFRARPLLSCYLAHFGKVEGREKRGRVEGGKEERRKKGEI